MSVQGDIKKEVIRYKLNRAEGEGGIQWRTVEYSGEQWRTVENTEAEKACINAESEGGNTTEAQLKEP